MQHLSFQFSCVFFFNVCLTSCLTTSFPQLEAGTAREHHWADKKEHETEVGIQEVSHFKGSPAPLLSYFKARHRGLLKKGQYTFKLSLLRDTQSWRILLFWKWWRRHALTACCCFIFLVFSSPQSKPTEQLISVRKTTSGVWAPTSWQDKLVVSALTPERIMALKRIHKVSGWRNVTSTSCRCGCAPYWKYTVETKGHFKKFHPPKQAGGWSSLPVSW